MFSISTPPSSIPSLTSDLIIAMNNDHSGIADAMRSLVDPHRSSIDALRAGWTAMVMQGLQSRYRDDQIPSGHTEIRRRIWACRDRLPTYDLWESLMPPVVSKWAASAHGHHACDRWIRIAAHGAHPDDLDVLAREPGIPAWTPDVVCAMPTSSVRRMLPSQMHRMTPYMQAAWGMGAVDGAWFRIVERHGIASMGTDHPYLLDWIPVVSVGSGSSLGRHIPPDSAGDVLKGFQKQPSWASQVRHLPQHLATWLSRHPISDRDAATFCMLTSSTPALSADAWMCIPGGIPAWPQMVRSMESSLSYQGRLVMDAITRRISACHGPSMPS
jgi:hypothetical protein